MGECKPLCTNNMPVLMPVNQMPQYFPLGSGGGGGSVPPYDPNSFYGEGTVISYNGKYYAANADIPAGTAFVVGTTGETWREVNLATSTIPPFSATKAYVQYEAVNYLGVLYTSIDQHDAGPWDPAQWTPLSTSGGVTVNVDNTQTVHMSGDGSVGAPIIGEVNIATALPDNILVATGSGLYASMDVTTTDTATIDFEGDGSGTVPLTAAVKISATAGNQLTANGTGLFVPAPAAATITANDTATVDVTGNGSAGSPLTAAVKKSATPNNSLALNADGLWTPTFAATDTATIDFTGSGTVAAPLQAAVKVSADADNALVAVADGLYVPASSGGALTIADTNSVNLEGDGSVGTPLTAAVKRSATAGNAITENADGLYVATVTPGISTVTANDSTTMDFSGNGTAGSPLTASVKKATQANNAVVLNADGIYVANQVPTGGSTGAFLRKSANTDFAVEWAQGVRLQTEGGTARTLVLTDQDLTLIFNNAGTKTVTVPTNATVALPIGTNVPIVNTGAGILTVAPAAGVTINKPADQSLTLATFNTANLLKTGTNEWLLIGGMVPL